MKIFISYRRGLDNDAAGRLHDRLVLAFGEDAVFRDVDEVSNLIGLDFQKVIDSRVAECTAFIAVIGPGWIASIDRLKKADDFVRIEVEAAIARDKILVIPVMVGDTELPKTGSLPDKLRPLLRRGGISLPNAGYSSAVEVLISAVSNSAEPPVDPQGGTAKAPAGSDQTGTACPPTSEPGPRTQPGQEANPRSGRDTDLTTGTVVYSPPARQLLGITTAVIVLASSATWIGTAMAWNNTADRVIGRLSSAVPNQMPTLLHREVVTNPIVPPREARPGATAEELSLRLEPEILAGVLIVRDRPDGTLVRIPNLGMFAPGEAEISPSYLVVVDRIARLIGDHLGLVEVIGFATRVEVANPADELDLPLSRAVAVLQQLLKADLPSIKLRVGTGGLINLPDDANPARVDIILGKPM